MFCCLFWFYLFHQKYPITFSKLLKSTIFNLLWTHVNNLFQTIPDQDFDFFLEEVCFL